MLTSQLRIFRFKRYKLSIFTDAMYANLDSTWLIIKYTAALLTRNWNNFVGNGYLQFKESLVIYFNKN